MLSNTISNYTIHHIISSNIIKCLTVIQLNEKEKEKVSLKEIPTDWQSERKKRKRALEIETKWRHQKREKQKNNNLSEICI